MIDRTPLHRPRVSRETRQLLATVLVAVVTLWVLGRVRYPERPSTPNPVPALLTQLAPRPSFGELAAESARLRERLGESLLAVRWGETVTAALRIGNDTAIALMRGASSPPGHGGAWIATRGDAPEPLERGLQNVLAADPATGLAVLRVHEAAGIAPPSIWTPRQLGEPRYLLATVASAETVALRPAFVAALQPAASPAWSAGIWAIPPAVELQPGALVFTADAELVGVVVSHGEGLAIVPGAALLADAQRVRQLPARAPGTLGIEVQPLTAALAAASGGRTGVIVSWVDPEGPAAPHLTPGDVIEAAEGRWIESREHWLVRAARLAAGEPIVLGVRRGGEWRDVQLHAATLAGTAPPLGLTLRRVPNVGSEIVDVARRSAADAAGLQPGDVITLAGMVSAPTPVQVRDAFAARGERQPLLVAISRGTTARVVALHR